MQSIPVIGTYLSFFLFGGEFPGEAIIPRLYTVHVLLLPGIILAPDHRAPHAGRACRSTPSTPARAGPNDNVVGYPFMPVYTAKAGGFFFIVFGVTALLAALATINPIWMYGPYDPSPVTAGSQPDWYMGFARRRAAADARLAGDPSRSATRCQPEHLHPGADPARRSCSRIAGAYPFIEALGHRRQARAPPARPAAQRPDPHRARRAWRSRSTWCSGPAGGNDIIATHFHLSINDITRTFRVAALRRSRRSPSWSPSGSASACSAATATWCCTATRPAASCGCRTASSSRSTSRSTSTSAGGWCSTSRSAPLALDAGRGRATAYAARAPRKDRLRAKLSRFYFDDRDRAGHPGRAGRRARPRPRSRRGRRRRASRGHREPLTRRLEPAHAGRRCDGAPDDADRASPATPRQHADARAASDRPRCSATQR